MAKKKTTKRKTTKRKTTKKKKCCIAECVKAIQEEIDAIRSKPGFEKLHQLKFIELNLKKIKGQAK